MFTGKKVMVVVSVFVFILGFSFAVQAYASQAQQVGDLATQYLRENYGVNSIEELRAKLEQQYLVKSGTDVLYSSYDAADAIQWAIDHNDIYSGLKIEQYPSFDPANQFETPTFEPITFNQPATVQASIMFLQYFGVSGLCLVGLMVVPAVRKRKWLKRVLAVSVIVLAAFSAGYLVGTISAQTGTIAIEPASFMETASYIISGEDTDNDGVLDIIYAKNGRTGQIEFSGSDAATVIQQAIDALTNGGKILIRAGNYTINTTLNIADNISIIGEGIDVTTLTYTGASNALELKGSGVFIADLTLKGNADSGHGIYGTNKSPRGFINLKIEDFGEDGVHIEYANVFYLIGVISWKLSSPPKNTGYGFYIKNCNVVLIESCTAYQNRVGIFLWNTNNVLISNTNSEYNAEKNIQLGPSNWATTIRDSYIDGADYGVWITSSDEYPCGNIKIENNRFYGQATASITIYYTTKVVIENNIFTGGANIAVELKPGASDIAVENNYFEDVITVFTALAGTTYKFRNNAGFVTENSGTATFTNTNTVSFTHGLAGTPTGVWCSFNNTDYGQWTWTANSTHITLTVTTANYNGTAYWRAEYKP
ncbi:hypothetical protein DRO69_08670 [Candidatus Bathyarchaeota archaeon]|nr:MAG: hypothetical protein DRO69_08670 [Candidatus Bathyarchaeota archaeon]